MKDGVPWNTLLKILRKTQTFESHFLLNSHLKSLLSFPDINKLPKNSKFFLQTHYWRLKKGQLKITIKPLKDTIKKGAKFWKRRWWFCLEKPSSRWNSSGRTFRTITWVSPIWKIKFLLARIQWWGSKSLLLLLKMEEMITSPSVFLIKVEIRGLQAVHQMIWKENMLLKEFK